VGRWRELIDNLFADLETETLGADGFRMNVDDKMWEAEKKASRAFPTEVGETSEQRVHDFQAELSEALSERLKDEPLNMIWREARSLLAKPRLRVPEHRLPDRK
jgi:hypothetical protein